MNDYGRYRTDATHIRARSANLNGSNVGDNAGIHQGDRNTSFKYWRSPASSLSNNPSGALQAQLEKREKLDCRRSLSFRDIDTRLLNISPVQPGTCEWFFETLLFQRWYDREHNNGLLWIKGNPGTGKSTLMKRILEYCQSEGDYAIAAYFFNARGSELEKTPLGMLRSLLFQLLKHEPSLYDRLLPMFRAKLQDYGSEDWEWREPELKSFFLSEMPKCRSRPLLLIIDALDECSDLEVHNIATFIQHLSSIATNVGITLNICLSSRHYPFIRFERYQELVLEKEREHDEDIINYISSKLTIRDEAIREAIREKSSGIFMWVALIIHILNRDYYGGKIEALKQKLNEMPFEVRELIETILNGDNSDKNETVLLLQFVLFAKRPLTPEEMYFALIAGTNSQALGKWDPLKITPEVIRRRIISSSRGLVEIRKGEVETVQFIHVFVNDFLVRDNRLQRLDQGLMHDPIAKSHNRIRECCLSYLMSESLEPPKDKKISSGFSTHDAASSVSSLEYASGFPFLEYAASYLFDHAEEATSVGQIELLRILKDDRVFNRVQRLYNYYVYMDQVVGPLSLQHILQARGLHKLLAISLEMGAEVNARGRPRRIISRLAEALHAGRR